ncbi:MAG: bifunctional DNA primase/polymerase [Candidatus Bathyarchaeota archaeon]|nr:bifunctional DNA primase/polymerase [Candidatus Bathyarchaeota archaeon]
MPQNLREAAREYWRQGLNVVCLKGKKPLHEWKQWQEKRQSESDFEALTWSEADGFAIISGSKLDNDLFFGAIDFDVKNLPQETIDKGKQALKNLPTTQIEQTPSGGQHWIYFCNKKPRTVSAYHNEAAVELIGEGKLCIMAPSAGYKRLNDNPPTVVQDLEDAFYKALWKAGCNIERQQSKVWFDSEDLASKPYKGKNPPCISGLFKGAAEGLRNEYAIRVASFYLNFKRLQPKTVQKLLKNWNSFNQPPLPEKELENVFKSALQGKYVYGCADQILRSFCNRDECSIAPKVLAKLLSQEEKERAERLLADPKLLDYVLSFGRRRLIGEDNTLLINFIMICSGQTKYPISGILSGYSGSGKNESLRAIKPLIPPEWLFEFTTSTPEAVKYIPEEFSGTLLIYEMAGMESRTGTLGLRSVGEGESIETIYPMRDEETGKMMLGKAKTNARNFITTESDIGLHPDLYRRVFKHSLNDSDILTKRVLAKKLRDAMLPESLKQKLSLARSTCPYREEDFQNALRLLDWSVEVVVFPPSELLKLLDLALKKEQKIALRSHIEKILNFIRVLAILRQKQRLCLKDENDNSRYVIANDEDYADALHILTPTVAETISRLESRQAQALAVFENDEAMDKNRLAEKLGVSTRTAARILKNLADQGYLREIQTTKPYSYELAQNKPEHLALLENTSQYSSFYKKELEKFLNSTLPPCHSGVPTLKVENQNLGFDFCVPPVKNGTQENKPFSSFIRNEVDTTAWQGVQAPSNNNLSLPKQNSQKQLAFSERASGLNHISETCQNMDGSTDKAESDFLWRRTPPAERCELCGQFLVEYEINDVKGHQILRRCQSCFDRMRQTFGGSSWKNVGGLDFRRQNQAQNDNCQVGVS